MGPLGELKYWLSGPKMEQEGGALFFFNQPRHVATGLVVGAALCVLVHVLGRPVGDRWLRGVTLLLEAQVFFFHFSCCWCLRSLE